MEVWQGGGGSSTTTHGPINQGSPSHRFGSSDNYLWFQQPGTSHLSLRAPNIGIETNRPNHGLLQDKKRSARVNVVTVCTGTPHHS